MNKLGQRGLTFALQIRDEDFDKARELLGENYDDKSNLLIFDPLTGEPPAGQFILIAISNIWIPMYADRISGYLSKIEDIQGLVKTANYLGAEAKETIKIIEEKVELPTVEEKGISEITPAKDDNNFYNISQDEDVQDFYLEPEKPAFVEVVPEKEDSNDFSFEFEEEKPEIKVESKKEEEFGSATKSQEKLEIGSKPQEVISVLENKEVKRIYLSDSDMSYTVGVSIHIKYSSKIIAIVDEKMFQKYGDCLDENVYIFKSFREVEGGSFQNYILIITAKDKAQDKEILEYSKNPIAYWEEVNNWVDKQK